MRLVLMVLLLATSLQMGVFADFYVQNKVPAKATQLTDKGAFKGQPSIKNGVLKWGSDPFRDRGVDRIILRRQLDKSKLDEEESRKKEAQALSDKEAEERHRQLLLKTKKQKKLERSLHYKVVAIWKIEKGYRALLSNRVIRVGSLIQDGKVRLITPRYVVLQRNGKPELTMKLGEVYRDIF